MLDFNTFTELSDESKFKLYEEVTNNQEFFKDLIKDLTNKIPAIPSVPTVTPRSPVTSAAEDVQQPGPQVSMPDIGKLHLFLPKIGNFSAMIIGDSITNRINAEEVGPDVLTRGFGGAKVIDICKRVNGSRKKQVQNISISVGVNDCLAPDFDKDSTLSSFEKLLYLCHDKFTPKHITMCTVAPVSTYRRENNRNIQILNEGIIDLIKNLATDFPVRVNVLDIHKIFSGAPLTMLLSDGLHPSWEGVKALVTSHRENFQKFNIDVSESNITMRERPIPLSKAPIQASASNHSRSAEAPNKSRASDELMHSFQNFIHTIGSK